MKRMTLWGEDENDERLIQQIINHGKTVTCTPKVWYYNSPDEEPTVIGDIVGVYNAKNILKCKIEITENYEISFGEVNLRIANGELTESIEQFKKNHVYCWERELSKDGYTLDDHTIIVVEHFKLISIN
jgi:uncharacterized protein YhfF